MNRIEIVQNMFDTEYRYIGCGYLAASRRGVIEAINGVLTEPAMSATAEVRISLLRDTSVSPLSMTSAHMRSLAKELNALAETMDAGLTVTEPESIITSTVLEQREDGTYYTGDLDAGKWLVCRDHYPKIMRLNTDPAGVLIELHDSPQYRYFGYVGAGPDEETAWRYAIGSACGPLDSEYDESYLLGALAQYNAE